MYNDQKTTYPSYNGTAPGIPQPIDELAERYAIGGLLYDPYKLNKTLLQSKHFWTISYQWIYEALIQVYNSGDFIDGGGSIAAVANKLNAQYITDKKTGRIILDKKTGKKRTKLDEIGGEGILVELINFPEVHSVREIPHYINKVVDFAERRQTIDKAGYWGGIAYDETIENWKEILSKDTEQLKVDILSYHKNGSQEQEVHQTPLLPSYARLTDKQMQEAKEAGKWLDDYIEFATKASPLTPCSFHTATGLFAGGLAIARRLYLPVSVKANWIYPNLYMLFIGHSTKPRKSTALGVVQGLLDEAGMSHFLLADRQSPEGLTLDLTTELPPKFDTRSQEIKDLWLRERAIAAQRGWLLDEASHLLDSFNRDYSSGLLPIVLDLYDSKDAGLSRNTISRGRENVTNAYMNIFGATTYGAMEKHAKIDQHWHNGLFARFALVGSDTSGEWQFWPPPMKYPTDLVKRLNFIAYQLLPMPGVTISSEQVSTEENIREVDLVQCEPLESCPVEIEPEAWKQCEKYNRAVSFDMLPENPRDVPSQFYASYGRLGTMMIKIAIILATFDSVKLPVIVQGKHIYRAQIIVESWRKNLHNILQKTEQAGDNGLAERIKEILAEGGTDWTARRDITRRLHISVKELEPIITELIDNEIVEFIEKIGSKRSKNLYRLLVT